jgi:predicted nucleic acid-binding Zn ribbon protein
MSRDLAREIFRAFKTHQRKNRENNTSDLRPRLDDPQAISSVLDELVTNRDWKKSLAQSSLFIEWETVVGREIADHAQPISFVDGRLTISATSTAWATQLRSIQTSLLETISQSAPGALVEELVILGPATPSWKKGLRTIKGARGPRDTYG